MTSTFPPVTIRLPDWVNELVPADGIYPSLESRMELVIDLSRRNTAEETGGPFGAVVFELESGRLIAPGVNLVVPSSTAMAHAEIVALAVAGVRMGSFDLGGPGMPATELVTSTEPCAMCFGAVPWSGVRRLVCGARDADARAIGFDEGPKMIDWVSALTSRGIEVIKDVERAAAARVLSDYAQQGGLIYNGRLGA